MAKDESTGSEFLRGMGIAFCSTLIVAVGVTLIATWINVSEISSLKERVREAESTSYTPLQVCCQDKDGNTICHTQ